jgi:hypothetical protein
MRRLKCYLLILIALWLPLQAAASVTMPFCRQAGAPAAHAVASVATAAHCHESSGESAVAQDETCDCDNCALCHLATTGYLLPEIATFAPLTTRVMVATLKPVLTSYIPDPLRQPPRR